MKQGFYITLLSLFFLLPPLSAQLEPSDVPLNGGKLVVNGKEFYLYKVKQSEGFYAITRRFGVSKEEIIEFNPEASAGLRLGQIIKLPVVQGRNSTEEELAESGKYLYHTVDSGQTLFFISRKYGVTESDISKINPGTEQVLLYGTQLKIPIVNIIEKPTRKDNSFLYHKIKPKETLYSISRIYGISVADLIGANPGIETSILQPDEDIRIPRSKPRVNDQEQVVLKVHPDALKAQDSKTWEDATYFYHYVVKGENLFNITQRYNADKNLVRAANNLEEGDGIKLGYYLKIPKDAIMKEKKEQMGKEFLVYKTLARRESLSLIAQKFGLKAADIVGLNPNIKKWDKIKRGTIINIPIKKIETPAISDTILEEVKHQIINVDSILVAEAFLVGCDTLAEKRAWNIAILWPLFLDANDTFNIVRKLDVNGDTVVSIRDPKAIMYDVNGFREFYSGMLIAIDSLVRQGMEINLYTYDVDKDTALISQLIERGSLDDMDIIIGPVYREQVNCVSNFCLQNEIRMVTPYPTAAKTLESNPYMFQVSAPPDVFYKPAVDFIVKNYASYNIIVITSNDKSIRQEHFSAMLKRELYRHRMDQVEPIFFHELNYDKYSYGGLDKLISKTKENLIIVPSEKLALFNKVSPNIENLIVKKDIENMTVFGFPEWQKLGGREREMLFGMNTILYSPFYIDFDDPLTYSVVQRFKNLTFTEPKAEGNNSGYASYGLLGYDVAFYFISALKAFGAEFERCLPYLDVDLTTADFRFSRTNNWSGFENRNTYFIQYKRNFEIELLDQY